MTLFETYGIDWIGPQAGDDNDVIVPETRCPLSPTLLTELHALYDPLGQRDDFHICLYLNVLRFVEDNVD